MMGQQNIYFGHPTPFWKSRKKMEEKTTVNIDEMRKLTDIVNYDALHLQHAIINRTSEKVQKLLQKQELSLKKRKERLKHLLESEEQQYAEELVSLQRTEELIEEKRKLEKQKEKEEELEREKARECMKALEREKIARGMTSSKADEVQLRLMQKMQMEERRLMEEERRCTENMWHQVLLDDVRRKEMAERAAENKRQQEMVETRKKYDEQIANAQELRNRTIQEEREKENKRLALLREGLQREKFEEQRRKKQQQHINKVNYIEGHKERMSRFYDNLHEERRIDSNMIQQALEEMHQERRRKYLEMKNLQKTEKIFTEISQKEREEATKVEMLADKVIEEWQQVAKCKAEEFVEKERMKKVQEKMKLSADYKTHLEELNQNQAKEREARSTNMQRVRRMAREELSKKAKCAEKEFLNQMDYRRDLNEQIALNQQILISEQQAIEDKQMPFTRKPEYFRDKMRLHVDKSPGRNSTNPVHPFKRVMDSNEDMTRFGSSLPPISRCCSSFIFNSPLALYKPPTNCTE